MPSKKNGIPFATEIDLCAAFIGTVPNTWTAYPETGGFDILLVRIEDGFQIGVEAKLRLNGKVICQAAEGLMYWRVTYPGPDCRAVLVPSGVNPELQGVCRLLGITVIEMFSDADRRWTSQSFRPELPKLKDRYGDLNEERDWFERCPAARLKLPDYIPDVAAGASAPVCLTLWKVSAIKLVITLERRGYLMRQDFKHFCVHMSRWIDPYARWLVQNGSGGWVKGPNLPDFRLQHPVNFAQIEADYEHWMNPAFPVVQPRLDLTATVGALPDGRPD